MLGDDLDHLVGEVLDISALLVTVKSPGVGLIEHLLEFHIGHRRYHVKQWGQRLADPLNEQIVLIVCAKADQQKNVAWPEVMLLGDERGRRGVQSAGNRI